jgi:tetratricopeptide (TPR) repeat protein
LLACLALALLPGVAPAQPEDGPVWRARTRLGQFHKALESAGAAQARGDIQTAQAEQRAAAEHLREARALFDSADAGAGADPEVLLDYGEVLGALGDTDLAADVYERAATLAPDDPEPWLALGKARAALGTQHADAAADALREAAVHAEDSAVVAEARARLGLLYLEEGLYEFAGDAFADALTADEDAPLAVAGQACLAARSGDVLRAANLLDGMGRLSGAAASLLDRFLPRALADFEARRHWFPDEAAQHAAYGKLLLRANQVPSSLYPLERAVDLDPENYVYWNLLASAARFLGDSDRAIAAYENSLAVNPDQPFVEQTLTGLRPEAPDDRPLFMAPEE